MRPPAWMESVIRDFGRSAGVSNLALNDRGAAALTFANGMTLRLEYAEEALMVAVTVPWHGDMPSLKRLLSYSHPRAGTGLAIRTGLSRRNSALLAAARFPERDVTLPNLNLALTVLWRIAESVGGAA